MIAPEASKQNFFAAIVLVGTLAMAARPATDPDLWWHLRTGQLTLQNHAIFYTDPFSFTRLGQPWVNHEWLTDVAMWKIYSLFSWTGLIFGSSLIASAAFLLVFSRCRTNPSIGAIFTIVGVAAAMASLGPRPQVISLLMFSLCLWILDRWERQPNFVFLLVPQMLLWVNLHAGFAVAFALMLCYLMGHLVGMGIGIEKGDEAKTKLARLAIAFALCLAAVPVNPYGFRMYRYPIATVTSPSMQRLIQEWASPDFHLAQQLPMLTLLLAGLTLLAITRRRLRPTEVVLLLAATLGSLLSVRYHPLSVVIAIPILARVCGCWLSEFRGAHLSFKPQSSRRILSAGVVVAALAIFAGVRIWQLRQQQAASERRLFPEAAASFLLKHRPSGNLWNPYDWGGYLIRRFHGTQAVFIDGRADLYGDELLEDSSSTLNLEGDWQSQLTRWQIQTALLPPDAPLTTALKRLGWRTIYSDSISAVLTRE